MKKYKVVEVYDEKVVETTTDSFNEAIMVYTDQINGTSYPCDSIAVFVWTDGGYYCIYSEDL